MTGTRRSLSSVAMPGPDGLVFLRLNGVELYIVADGQGPMGYYDRIHCIDSNGVHTVIPAHHAEQFTYSGEEDD